MLAGKVEQTANNYVRALELLLEDLTDLSLTDTKTWLESIESPVSRRKRGQAIRAFGYWAKSDGYETLD